MSFPSTSHISRNSTLLVPALMYFISNVTAMHALSHMRSYIFTAIMNLRIIFAALFSKILLHKSIKTGQWRAITVIFCAATALCLEDMKTDEEGKLGLAWREDSFGMLIAVGTALASAAGGVLVEKYLSHSKSTTTYPLLPPLTSAMVDDEDKLIVCREAWKQHQSSFTPLAHPRVEAEPSCLRTEILWEQQGPLAFFSAVFATLYVVLFMQDTVRAYRVLEGWTRMTVLIMFMQAIQGILVAVTIQRYGIVFRLILGTISICLCILIESLLFFEPIVLREVLNIVIVIVGSNMYNIAISPLQSSSFGGSGGTVRKTTSFDNLYKA